MARQLWKVQLRKWLGWRLKKLKGCLKIWVFRYCLLVLFLRVQFGFISFGLIWLSTKCVYVLTIEYPINHFVKVE